MIDEVTPTYDALHYGSVMENMRGQREKGEICGGEREIYRYGERAD